MRQADRIDLLLAERKQEYGPVTQSLTRIGRHWGAVLGIPDIPPETVSQMLVVFKVSRESGAHKADNLDDEEAYVRMTRIVWEERERERQQ